MNGFMNWMFSIWAVRKNEKFIWILILDLWSLRMLLLTFNECLTQIEMNNEWINNYIMIKYSYNS